MVMVLHNIMGVPETSVYVGVYSTAEVCQHNLQIFGAAEPTVELHCSEQPVLTW